MISNEFKNNLGQMESGNNYQEVNENSGALGKYQFMPVRLNDLMQNYDLPIWYNYFLGDPGLQELYFNQHVEDILNYVYSHDLDSFIGKQVVGTKKFPGMTSRITTEGLIAGAHLGGKFGLKNFLLNGINPDDGRTSISDYVAYFSKNSISPVTLTAIAVVLGIVYLAIPG